MELLKYFKRSSLDYKDYDVTITIHTANHGELDRIYTVKAKDEEHAARRAKIKADIECEQSSLEEKWFGMVHDTKWYQFWRLRNYERGVKHIFSNLN